MTEPERPLICLCGKKIVDHSQEEIRACALKFMGEEGKLSQRGLRIRPIAAPAEDSMMTTLGLSL